MFSHSGSPPVSHCLTLLGGNMGICHPSKVSAVYSAVKLKVPLVGRLSTFSFTLDRIVLLFMWCSVGNEHQIFQKED